MTAILPSAEQLKRIGITVPVVFHAIDAEDHTLRVKGNDVWASSLSAAFRGAAAVQTGLECDETSPFKTIGAMLDTSRNAVPTVATVKRWLNYLAQWGYNQFMLYCENTYKLPDEPAFGFQRGAYSAEEIREIDDYAFGLGIEVVPCIQTLGHMESLLHWRKHYGDMKDVTDVMLIDCERTYQLIEKMLDFWNSNLRSNRIHIGMDEVENMCFGQYRHLHGIPPRFEVFSRHLARVVELCEKRGIKPMMWSDMYCKFASKNDDYYDVNVTISKEIADSIPKNVQLVFWDYYHEDKSIYTANIKKHRDIGFEPIFASAARCTREFWADSNLSNTCLEAGMKAAREAKIKETIITIWHDNGSVAFGDSVLPILAGNAGVAYGEETVFAAASAKRFEAATGYDFKRFQTAGELELFAPGKYNTDFRMFAIAAFWDDPLMGFSIDGLQAQYPYYFDYAIDHYKKLAEKLSDIDDHPVRIAKALYAKISFRRDLERAYDAKDINALRNLKDAALPELIKLYDAVCDSFRTTWRTAYKSFGLDVIQLRNAGQIERLRETQRVLAEFIEKGTPILELEEPRTVKHTAMGYEDATQSGDACLIP